MTQSLPQPPSPAVGPPGRDSSGGDPVTAGYGGPVPAVPRDDTSNTATLPWPTRFRLQIEALWDELAHADPVHAAAARALVPLHERARQEEALHLAQSGVARTYLIIRPVNLLSLPPAGDMARIRDAITTLAALGMLCGPGGDD